MVKEDILIIVTSFIVTFGLLVIIIRLYPDLLEMSLSMEISLVIYIIMILLHVIMIVLLFLYLKRY